MFFFFFFNDTATTEIYTLSLHDALPISRACAWKGAWPSATTHAPFTRRSVTRSADRKSTRLNSSHLVISYAVFCLKKKKQTHNLYCRPHYRTPVPTPRHKRHYLPLYERR